MTTPTKRIRGFSASVAQDGEVTFEIKLADSTQATVSVPFNDLADFILGLEAKAGEALAMLNAASRGGDRRLMMPLKPRRVTRVQGSAAKGTPVLSLELDGRLALDMALPQGQIQDLIEYLQELQNQANRPPSKTN